MNRAPALPLILNLAGHFTASFLDFMFLVVVRGRGTRVPKVDGEFRSSKPLTQTFNMMSSFSKARKDRDTALVEPGSSPIFGSVSGSENQF